MAEQQIKNSEFLMLMKALWGLITQFHEVTVLAIIMNFMPLTQS